MSFLIQKSEHLKTGDRAVGWPPARSDARRGGLPIRNRGEGNECPDAKEFGFQTVPGYVAEVSGYVAKDFDYVREDFGHVGEDFGHVGEDFGHVAKDSGNLVKDLEYMPKDLEYISEKAENVSKTAFLAKNHSFAANGPGFYEISRLKGFAAFVGLIVAFLILWTPQSNAQPSATERKLEAVFMFNFVQYIEWPTNAFETPESPFVIGVLGDDPFGHVLDETVEGETVRGRKLQIRRYKKIGEIKDCQVLFISSSEAGNLKRILAALKGRSILTVSDIDSFAQAGGMIRFVKTNNKVRFRINVESAKQAHLSISAKLLQLADLVPDEQRR